MSSDVVRLVRHARWDIRIGAHTHEEHTEIANAHIVHPADKRKTDDCDYRIEYDDRAAKSVFVTEPTSGIPGHKSAQPKQSRQSVDIHPDACRSIWRRNKTLRLANGEAHPRS